MTYVENPHLYRQLLRAGNLEVGGAVSVLRNFLQMIGGSYPHYFEHVLPFNKYSTNYFSLPNYLIVSRIVT